VADLLHVVARSPDRATTQDFSVIRFAACYFFMSPWPPFFSATHAAMLYERHT
jgi:hypothetical protein